MENVYSIIENLKGMLNGDSIYMSVLLKSIAAIIGSLLIWLILKFILNSFEKKIKRTEFFQKNLQTFPLIKKVVFYVIVFITGSYILGIFNVKWLGKVFYAVMLLLTAVPVKEFVTLALKYLETRIVTKTENKIDDIVFDILNKFTGAIIFSIAIIFALDILGINIMPIIAGAGIAGVAIGFAAKDTLSNLIAGILLIVDRPFELGDRIEVWNAPSGSSTWGDVIDIGLRATKIKTTDNIVIIIPNNEIMKRDIINYTIINSKIRVRINIGVAYDSDIDKVKELILKVADSVEWLSQTPPPKVVVRNFGESSVDLQLRIWIENARRRMDTISYVTDKVKSIFNKEGIEIPFPTREIFIRHVTGEPSVLKS